MILKQFNKPIIEKKIPLQKNKLKKILKEQKT